MTSGDNSSSASGPPRPSSRPADSTTPTRSSATTPVSKPSSAGGNAVARANGSADPGTETPDTLKELFQGKLYKLLSKPEILASLETLLTSNDRKESRLAWQMVFAVALPTTKDGESAGGKTFHLHMNVPRPDQSVAIDISETDDPPPR